MGDKQTCPRRMSDYGPWERSEGLDSWECDRWGVQWRREFVYWWVNRSPVQRWVRAYCNWGWTFWRAQGTPLNSVRWRLLRASLNWSNWIHGGTKWPWPWQPRTCSFCGGVHPDDATALVTEGWRVEGTDKGYKRYLEPPAQHDGAVPPVKLYVQHFDAQQIARFNEAAR